MPPTPVEQTHSLPPPILVEQTFPTSPPSHVEQATKASPPKPVEQQYTTHPVSTVTMSTATNNSTNTRQSRRCRRHFPTKKKKTSSHQYTSTIHPVTPSSSATTKTTTISSAAISFQSTTNSTLSDNDTRRDPSPRESINQNTMIHVVFQIAKIDTDHTLNSLSCQIHPDNLMDCIPISASITDDDHSPATTIIVKTSHYDACSKSSTPYDANQTSPFTVKRASTSLLDEDTTPLPDDIDTS